MTQPKVEFFTDDVDGTEYLNVGLVWTDVIEGMQDEEKRAVLGAFTGEISQEAMIIIKGLVEQAVIFVLGLEE